LIDSPPENAFRTIDWKKIKEELESFGIKMPALGRYLKPVLVKIWDKFRILNKKRHTPKYVP